MVAHVRKPSQGGEAYIPNKFDVRGAGELVDLVDNLLVVWADKKKEQLTKKVLAGLKLSDSDKEYYEKNPDQRLICCKQRHGAWEGQVALWFNPDSLQFTADSSGQALPFHIPRVEAVA